MTLDGKSIVSIDDLSNSEIARILEVAMEFDESLNRQPIIPLLKDKKLFSLFYEPSSRTFFSFREAMRRLGGDWDGVQDAQSSTSVAKGESIADSIRTFELMADIIVMRHPSDGSVQVAQYYASKPVINAGDGAHEHPTQTLVDLYTILKEKGSIKGQVVALCGDLLHARTIHSLAYALGRLGAKIRTISPPDLGFPNYVRARLSSMKCDVQEYLSIREVFKEDSSLLYRAESLNESRKQLRGVQGQYKTIADLLQELDALYMTRLQTERIQDESGMVHAELDVITSNLLQSAPQDTILMHPLPRRKEIAYEVDIDKRAAYFRQMQNSIPVRMAILALVLGAKDSKGARARRQKPIYVSVPLNTNCLNARCVVKHESYVVPQFYSYPSAPEIVQCAYCEEVIPLDGGPGNNEDGVILPPVGRTN
jgi:aspartate carbamoyltransferase catalytic subunit